jgi:hypothetical protein
MTTGGEQQQFYAVVVAEAARQLDCDVLDLVVDFTTPDIVSQYQAEGEHDVEEIVRNLIEDEAIRRVDAGS